MGHTPRALGFSGITLRTTKISRREVYPVKGTAPALPGFFFYRFRIFKLYGLYPFEICGFLRVVSPRSPQAPGLEICIPPAPLRSTPRPMPDHGNRKNFYSVRGEKRLLAGRLRKRQEQNFFRPYPARKAVRKSSPVCACCALPCFENFPVCKYRRWRRDSATSGGGGSPLPPLR